ncbi:MAG: V-type ATP synthase subunit I [Candidatus Bathyarchaeia archaeon]
MLLPERMTSTSIICVKKDIEAILETLSDFGEFHIIEEVQEDNIDISECKNSIQRLEEAIINVDALIKQFANEKGNLLDLFKDTQPTKTVVTANNWHTLTESTLQKIANVINETGEVKTSLTDLYKEAVSLNHTKDMLTNMQAMNADLATMNELNLIHVIFASIPVRNMEGLQTALASYPVYLNQRKLGKDINFICVATPNTHYTDVDRLLKTYHAEMFQVPKDLPENTAEAIKEVDNRLKANAEKEKELTSRLNKIGEDNKKYFAAWKETAENILLLLNTKTKILQSERLATVKGFIPTEKFKELSDKLNKMLNGKVVVIKNDETTITHPVQVEKSEKSEKGHHEAPAVVLPPTRISHNMFVRPFEELTKLYGLPKYNEIDPTPIMAITFPILFGLMFGDLGHGLLLLIGGLTVGKLIRKNQGMKNLCYIMAACGVSACVAGVLFGEFFGLKMFEPLWFSPFENVFTFLIFCMFVGIAQILVGLAIEMGNYIVNHKIADAVLTSIPKIAFFIGGIYIIYNYQLNFGAWLSGPILAAIIPIVILIIGKPAYLAIAKPANYEPEEADGIANRLFESGDVFTRLLGNTISYSRILALLMAHWALMLVVYKLAELIGAQSIVAIILSTVVIIFGNIFVLALEGLIVFIHTLRLHFYEWFSKFYTGTGTAFTPLKQKHTYTDVVFEKEETASETKQQ